MLAEQPAFIEIGAPDTVAAQSTPTPRPSRKTVEPWSSLLLGGQRQEEHCVEVRKLSSSRPDVSRWLGPRCEVPGLLRYVSRTRVVFVCLLWQYLGFSLSPPHPKFN